MAMRGVRVTMCVQPPVLQHAREERKGIQACPGKAVREKR